MNRQQFHLSFFILMPLIPHLAIVSADQTVSYFSWFPATEYKTITFIPPMEYDRAAQMCTKMRGMLLTFTWHEIMSINNDLQQLYGPNEYWVGLTKDYGVIRWADGTYFHPSMGLNISFMNDQNSEKTCAAVQVMNGYNNYMIQLTNCNLSKKAICEAWRTIGLFGILSISALVLSGTCLILLFLLFVRGIVTNKRSASSHRTYAMKTSTEN